MTTTPTSGSASAPSRVLRRSPMARLMARSSELALTQANDEPLALGEILQNLIFSSPSSTRRPDLSPVLKRQALWRQANMPQRHEVTRGREHGPEWKAAAERITRKIGSGMLFGLLGKRGTGKTHMALLAAAASIHAERSALYVKAMDVFFAVRAAFKSETLTELDVLAEFLSPKLLVIDEISERGESEWEDRTLIYIIDKRYDAMLDTVLIGNLLPQEFGAAMGSSIVSRLVECGGLIECTWPSFRKQTEPA